MGRTHRIRRTWRGRNGRRHVPLPGGLSLLAPTPFLQDGLDLWPSRAERMLMLQRLLTRRANDLLPFYDFYV